MLLKLSIKHNHLQTDFKLLKQKIIKTGVELNIIK